MMGYTLPQVKQRTGMIIFDAATTPPPPLGKRGRVWGDDGEGE
jgi:hypothetical protein